MHPAQGSTFTRGIETERGALKHKWIETWIETWIESWIESWIVIMD
jgi:hypothetical protein